MGKLILEPVFKGNEPIGSITSMFLCGANQFMFEYGKHSVPRDWRKEISGIMEMMVVDTEYDEDGDPVSVDDNFWETCLWNADRNDLYLYQESPTKADGYVFLSTSEISGMSVKNIIKQEHYPENVWNGGETEKFFYDYLNNFKAPTPFENNSYWDIGDKLEVDDDVLYMYYYKEHEWNDLYWNLRNSIGRAWKDQQFLEACVYIPNAGYDQKTERKLYATTDAQKLLFWAIEHEYKLSELKEMAETGHIIEHYKLLTTWW